MAWRQEETNLVRLLMMKGAIKRRRNRETHGPKKWRSQENQDNMFLHESHP
jgi:hypothetical protein